MNTSPPNKLLNDNENLDSNSKKRRKSQNLNNIDKNI